VARQALLIGVGKYHSERYQDLTRTVDSDLKLVREALLSVGVAAEPSVGLDGAEVSQTGLRAAITRFIENAAEGADLLIYYSGHGHWQDGVTYLVPSDAHPELSDREGFLVEIAFDKALARSNARSVSFVIDACRTPLDEQDADRQHPVPSGAGRPRTTIVYACAPGDSAPSLAAYDGSSLFTLAFAALIAAAGHGVPLNELKQRLDLEMARLGRDAGLDLAAAVDLWVDTGLARMTAFAFFTAGRSTAPGERWTGLLREHADELGFPSGGSARAGFDSVCAGLDAIEAGAPPLYASPLLMTLPDLTLPERLARATVLVLRRVQRGTDGHAAVTTAERLTVIAVAGALEAAARQAELAMAEETDARWRHRPERPDEGTLSRLRVIAPQFERAYQAYQPSGQRMLDAWCDRVLSLREAIKKPQALRSALTDLLPRAYGAGLGDLLADLPGYLVRNLHEQFIGRESGTSGREAREERERPRRVLPPGARGGEAAMLDGRRVAALVRLVWLLAADTRLLPPDLGLSLIQDQLNNRISLGQALHPLGDLAWLELGEQVIDLNLRTTSAPLDQALRQLTADISKFLLAARQPGMPLAGVNVPYAATATWLDAASGADGTRAFRLPHARFEVSVAETHELLMGTNLYSDPLVAIRELYQNAADACTYRQWRIRNAADDPAEEEGSWEPEITFRTGNDRAGTWIECEDHGVGMSEYELRESFAKVGKRFRDLPEFLEETKEWEGRDDAPFRPISQFGIGVLSYFMIAKEVVLWTIRSDDRGHSYGDPLEVRIADASSIFRIGRPAGRPLPNAGTTVRLYLRKEFAHLDLADALRQVIAAPLVRTKLTAVPGKHEELRWIPGRLYQADGDELSAFAVKELGVYFHEGSGRVLVNGIPLNALGAPPRPSDALRGVTVSLDVRTAPRLSIDRSRLHAVDMAVLQDLLVAAAGKAAAWPEASISWLLALFTTDKRAGIAAYRALASQELRPPISRPTRRRRVDEAGPGVSPAATDRVPTPQLGVSVFDPALLLEPSTEPAARDWVIREDEHGSAETHRLRARRSATLLSADSPAGEPGFPVFDERLISLLSHPWSGWLPLLGEASTAARQDLTAIVSPGGRSGRADASLPECLRDIAGLAAAQQTSISAVAVYAWAVRLLSQPARMALPRLIRGIDEWESPDQVRALVNGPVGKLPLFTPPDSDHHREYASVVFLASPLAGHHGPEFAATVALFPGLTPASLARAYAELGQEAAGIVGSIYGSPGAAPDGWFESQADVLAEAQSFMARFPDLFPADWTAWREETRLFGSPLLERINALPMSAPLRWALFAVFEGLADDFNNPKSIPSIDIAFAALCASEKFNPENLCAELTSLGYQLDVPADWQPALRAARTLLPLSSSGLSVMPSRLGSDLERLEEIARLLPHGIIRKACTQLRQAGYESDNTRRISELRSLRRADVADLQEVLTAPLPTPADIVALVNLAHLRSVTLGSAFKTLADYRPLIAPHWRLPEQLPATLARRRPSMAELALVADIDSGGNHDWVEQAIRASALTGIALAELADTVLPLMDACGEPTAGLLRLRAAWPDAVTFDDLLILGCLDAWPALSPADVNRTSRPFSRDPETLTDRISRWLEPAAGQPSRPADAWTERQRDRR